MTELADFLRASRSRVHPGDVGFAADAKPRRVPGLRREEVAQLANVSVDYLVRLEQGRTTNVSRGVLESLADALQPAPDAREYLLTIAGPADPAPPVGEVRDQTRRLLASLDLPALVVGRALDVLAWNPVAAALFAEFGALEPERRNMVRMVFLDPDYRAMVADWPQVARECVAYLRRDAGHYPDDPRLAALVEEVSAADPDFRTWWVDHRVRMAGFRRKTFLHPRVGPVTVDSQRLGVETDPGQFVVVYSAEPGSASEAALRSLAEMALTG
ncbi:helix-turn-helix transcriptional regulator [Amycolatopsis sp. NPDC050768]|uniref:helix-turn-helix transcriptional regulator n=1 Tax=Amycolatopsis sp. NPDC050768 TaxID=3154839 RepID=UPI0033E7E7A7